MSMFDAVMGAENVQVRLWAAWVHAVADPAGQARIATLQEAAARTEALAQYRAKLADLANSNWTPKAAAELEAARLVTIDITGPLTEIRQEAETHRADALAWLRTHTQRPEDVTPSDWAWGTAKLPAHLTAAGGTPWQVN